MKIGVKFERVK